MKNFSTKSIWFIAAGLFAASILWAQPKLASEYCNTTMGSTEEHGAAIGFTWETNATGDVIITLSEVDGGDAGTSLFRINGMCPDDLSRFKVGGQNASNYFERVYTEGTQTYTLKLKDGETAPAYGTAITFTNQQVEYKTSLNNNAWPNLTFSYTYGSTCAALDKPINVAVSSAKVITFDAISGAISYKAFVYWRGDLCYEQEVTNGGTLNFTPRIASTYQVIVQAYGMDDSFSPISDEYDWVITTGTPGGYAPVSSMCEYVMGTTTASEVLISWATNLENGDIEVTISPKEESDTEYTYWEEDGLRISGFRFNGENTFANYFDAVYSQSNQVPANTTKLIYHPKTTGEFIPRYGDIITFANDYIVYHYNNAKTWPNNIVLPDFTYGTNCDVSNDHVAPIIEITEISSTFNSVTLQIDVTEKNDADEDCVLRSLTIRDEANGYAEEDVILDGDNQITLSSLKYNTTYNFTVKSVDFGSNITEETIEVILPFNTELDLARGRGEHCTSGAVQDANTPDRAVNGNADNFWTCFGNGESLDWWWKVDLGTAYDINQVKIHFADVWEAYSIYGSANNAEWIAIVEGADADNNATITYSGLVMSARYLKVTSAGSHLGIREFEVYGTAFSVPDATNPTVSVTCPAKTINSVTLQIDAADLVDSGDAGAIAEINISGDNGFETQNDVTLDGSNQITLSGLTYNTTYTFTVTVLDRARNEASANITVQLPLNTNLNLAQGKTAVAGKTQTGYNAYKGCDGDAGTAWSSYGTQDQSKEWWYVDLEALYTIRQVKIKWMNDYAVHFLIQGATTLPAEEDIEDDNAWTTYRDYTYTSNPGNEIQTHDLVGKMRYLRLKSLQNEIHLGMEFYELEVYGSDYAEEDNVAPVIGTKECTTDTETATATLTLTATDAVDGAIKDFYISCENPVIAEAKYTTNGDDQIAFTGLQVDKDYTFAIRCRDLSGNWIETNVVAHFAMALGTNVAEGKTATDGRDEGGNTADKAVDGNETTYWGCYPNTADATTTWLKVDLGNAYKFDNFVVKWEHYPDNGGIIIEGSLNDETYTEIISYTGARFNQSDRQVLEITGEQANIPYKYVRIKAENQDYYMSIYEFEAYASEEIPFVSFGDESTTNAATIAALHNNIVDVLLNRTILTNDGWYTLCLPFDVSAEKVVEVFGNSTIAQMTDAEDRGSLIHLNFEYVDAIEAGHAYLFKPGVDFAAGTIIEGVTIKNVSPIVSGDALMHFQGVYDKTILTDSNIRFVADDDYLYSPAEGGTTMGAFRCYFTIPDGSSANAPGKRARIVLNGHQTTDLENVEGDKAQCTKVLRDGQLLIIRDGRTYNAQGLLIR